MQGTGTRALRMVVGHFNSRSAFQTAVIQLGGCVRGWRRASDRSDDALDMDMAVLDEQTKGHLCARRGSAGDINTWDVGLHRLFVVDRGLVFTG